MKVLSRQLVVSLSVPAALVLWVAAGSIAPVAAQEVIARAALCSHSDHGTSRAAGIHVHPSQTPVTTLPLINSYRISSEEALESVRGIPLKMVHQRTGFHPYRALADREIVAWGSLGRRVLHKLAGDDVHAYLGFHPRLRFVSDALPHAFISQNGTLTFSSGILNLLESRSEFAFILAHELAHGVLGHHHHSTTSGTTLNFEEFVHRETEADRIALQMLAEGGYQPEDSLRLVERLVRFGENYGLSLQQVHPSLAVRQQKLAEHFLGEQQLHKRTA